MSVKSWLENKIADINRKSFDKPPKEGWKAYNRKVDKLFKGEEITRKKKIPRKPLRKLFGIKKKSKNRRR